METVLIIEDDTAINNMLSKLLSQNGYNTKSAYSGTEGLLVHGEDIDLILLDIMLPGKSGDEIIEELKSKHNIPIIVMSAISDVDKKVDMFLLGADDYITKPFSNEELLARIAVRLKTARAQGNGVQKNACEAERNVISFRDIELDLDNYVATCKGIDMRLSKNEFELLKLFMKNSNRICTKSLIYDVVWDYENSADDNTLNVHISKLRKKLKECNPEEEYIETVWGVGYRLCK